MNSAAGHYGAGRAFLGITAQGCLQVILRTSGFDPGTFRLGVEHPSHYTILQKHSLLYNHTGCIYF